MPDRKKTLKEFDRITAVLVDALILLQDQPEVVFCKDCKYMVEDNQFECGLRDFPVHEYWFCADGERK